MKNKLDSTSALLVCSRRTSGWVVLVEDDSKLFAVALDELVTALCNWLGDELTAMAKFYHTYTHERGNARTSTQAGTR